jgi:hypothetical protein
MPRLIVFFLLFPLIYLASSPVDAQLSLATASIKNASDTETLPFVLPAYHANFIESRLRNLAVQKFAMHQLSDNIKDWNVLRQDLKNRIIEKAGVTLDHKLPLAVRETGRIQLKGYSIRNVPFQTRPGVYATANLYIHEGKGPFPAVINMLGHWRKGKVDKEGPQPVGHVLALNGYGCLSIDSWGLGERTTVHGGFGYHGANFGASLMNIGETMAGLQISDNMSAIDLLTSLPYVEAEKIGATGASGGGNQTLWLAAIDERVKAAVSVVSVGTLEFYIMRSNCVCELLPDGLTFTEEAGIVAMVAPRAFKMCNHLRDASPTFFPSEMDRSFNNSKPIFKMMGVENNITSQVIDETHGYWPQHREAMLGWFDRHLKGIGAGSPKKESHFELLPEEKLLIYPAGKRDSIVMSTDVYCIKRGKELRTSFLNTNTFNKVKKKEELCNILRLNEKSGLKKIHTYTGFGGWDQLAMETSDKKLIPLLHQAPHYKLSSYIIVSDPQGKNNIKQVCLRHIGKKVWES